MVPAADNPLGSGGPLGLGWSSWLEVHRPLG